MTVTLNQEFLNKFHEEMAQSFAEDMWHHIKEYAHLITDDSTEFEAITEFLVDNTTTVSVS